MFTHENVILVLLMVGITVFAFIISWVLLSLYNWRITIKFKKDYGDRVGPVEVEEIDIPYSVDMTKIIDQK